MFGLRSPISNKIFLFRILRGGEKVFLLLNPPVLAVPTDPTAGNLSL